MSTISLCSGVSVCEWSIPLGACKQKDGKLEAARFESAASTSLESGQSRIAQTHLPLTSPAFGVVSTLMPGSLTVSRLTTAADSTAQPLCQAARHDLSRECEATEGAVSASWLSVPAAAAASGRASWLFTVGLKAGDRNLCSSLFPALGPLLLGRIVDSTLLETRQLPSWTRLQSQMQHCRRPAALVLP